MHHLQAAEVPGLSREQLASIKLRRQQLEDGIEDYIKARQQELRDYEQEVCVLHLGVAHSVYIFWTLICI
jgi:hypothetical protein